METKYQTTNLNSRFNQPSEGYNTKGVDIFKEDWDNLIILDSCRFDYFSELVNFNGKLESRESRGSKTKEFILGNFQGESLYDTVYVSGNNWYTKILDDLGDDRADVYRFEFVNPSSNKREIGHVRLKCEKITEKALQMHSEHPNKRLIVHYLPPHKPYVDEQGNIIVDWKDTSLFHQKQKGLTEEQIKEAYRSSVKFILDHITPLVDRLSGLTVITSDHGELLNDRMKPIPIRRYGHPEGIYVEELLTIPWFTCEYEQRREIRRSENPHPSMTDHYFDSDEVDQHLRDLGYKI